MDTEQLKVLLVEDDPGDVDYLQEMLSETEGLQFELVCVDRLKAALECLREGDRQFDVMILDLGLPDSVGLETFRQIHHQALSIPIVVMTALNDSDMAMEAVREGAQDYLVKGDLTSTLLVRSIRYAVERHRMEQELRASEKRFRLFYEDAPMAYQSLDPNGCLLDVNRQWVALLGYSRDQVIGKWFGDFLTPSSQDHFKVNFLRFKAVGEVHNVHFDMIRKDGSALTAELHGRVSLDDQLRFNHAHCLFHDITERRRFEQALTASDKKYRTLFERSMDPVFIITRYGRLVEANQAFFHLFEYSEEDFEHIHISSVFVNPSDRVTVRREINERGSLKDYEIRLRTKSGAEIDCLLSATVRTS
ncbi:MAG: PAS domain S-box protein, partial [Deltaproteobacteria bacterium]|nr:PAS domain S-box protein [Deltaproteobacteria bacterium]